MVTSYPQLVLLGDSTLQYSSAIKDGFSFQAQLQAHCIRRLDVINRGLSGYNSENVLELIDDIIPPRSVTTPRIEYLLVLLGSNDASRRLATDPNCQHVPLDRFRENMLKIITHPNIVAHNPKVLLVVPPPIDEIRVTELDKPIYGETRRHSVICAAYAQKVRDLASELPGVVLIDLWKAIMDKAIELTPGFSEKEGAEGPMLGTPECGIRGALKDLLPDGLHIDGVGYKVFFDIVVPHVGNKWEDDKEWVYPVWKKFKSYDGHF